MKEQKVNEVIKLLIEGMIIERDAAAKRHAEVISALDGKPAATSNSLNHYQEEAKQYARYPDNLYPVLALAEEAGEVAALFAKAMRANKEEVDQGQLISELGDVLWNLAAIASENDISLAAVASYNLEKLEERKSEKSLTALKR